MNSHVIYGFAAGTAGSLQRVDVGLALYPVLPLLNHSCHPNTTRFNAARGGHVVVVAAEDIPEGAEVTDSYGQSCLTSSREDRRRSLLKNYNFKCNCR